MLTVKDFSNFLPSPSRSGADIDETGHTEGCWVQESQAILKEFIANQALGQVRQRLKSTKKLLW